MHSCQVCLAAALLHRISPLRAVAMVISQCGGAIAAAALVLGITGIARDHFPGLQKTDISLEFMLSFLAVLVQLGAGGGQGQGLSLESLFLSFQTISNEIICRLDDRVGLCSRSYSLPRSSQPGSRSRSCLCGQQVAAKV